MSVTSETANAAGGAFRQPKHIGVFAAIFVQLQLVVVAHRGRGACVDPFPELGVAVRKGQCAAAVVMTGRVIDDARLVHPVGLHHADGKPAPVDAVRMLVNQDKQPGRLRVVHPGQLLKSAVRRCRQPKTGLREPTLGVPGTTAQGLIHGDTPHSTIRPPVHGHGALVGRALVNSG